MFTDELIMAMVSGILGTITISIPVYLYYKAKTKKYEALAKIAQKGGDVDPEIVKVLTGTPSNHKSDIKNGLIWLAIGLPGSFGVLLIHGFALAVVASIPVFVGVAFLISAKLRMQGLL